MSSTLPALDVTGAIVGQVFKIDFTVFVKFNPAKMSENAHLQIYNESGAGLSGVLNQSGQTFFIPAGAWQTVNVAPNDSIATLVATYILPNAPVSKVVTVYYAPGEEPPSSLTLGNSPIGVSGAVQTSNVQTLSNEGAAAGLLVIDMGDAAFNQLLTMYNDGHSLWAVDQSGTKHQVIKIQTSGNPLQLGQAADITEILGNLTVDGTEIVTGDATFNGAGASITTANDTVVNGSLKTATIRDNIAGNAQILVSNVSAQVTVPNDMHVQGVSTLDGVVNAGSTLNVVGVERIGANAAISTVQLLVTPNADAAQGIRLVRNSATQSANMLAVNSELGALLFAISPAGTVILNSAGTIIGLTTGTVSIGASASVAVTHGLGNTPQAVLLTTDQATSSGTNSAYSYTSTQFTAFNGAGATLVYRWFAWR